MLKISGLSFSYKKKRLFDGLDLELGPGLYGLLGKNGAGKSTLLKLVSGQLFPDSGECTTLGYRASDRRPEMLSGIYYLPEEFSLPSISGNDYIAAYAPFYPDFDRKFFDSCAEEFCIDPASGLGQMSYGQKKKFMISFGLASWSRILLLDEPTNGLDIPSKSQFRRLAAAGAADERIILISTHQVRDMENLIDPIIIVENGRIIFNRSMEDVSSCMHVEHLQELPDAEKLVYSEKMMGGHIAAVKGRSEDGRAIDLEFLFNMVVSDSSKVNSIIEGGAR